MSVKGFYINGEVQRYDYDSLDNKPEDGLTEAAKTAILQLAEKVAYVDANGQTYYQALHDAFYGNFVNVTNTLTGCYSSNVATTTKQGAAYTATIIANSGYTLTGATVNITMGGSSVTGYYSNGTINIPNVTGDLVITVVAVSSISSISAVFTQGSATIYDTDSLDTLRQYLTVTAYYADTTSATVNDYELSGTLTAGTSTITVSYGGKTATFSVTVEQFWTFEWDYSMGKLEEQTGWKTDNGGTSSSSLVASGERITTDRAATNYYQIIPVAESPIRSMTNGYGIVEVTFIGHVDTSNSSGTSKLRVACSKDTTCRFQTHIIHNNFCIYDNTTDSTQSTVLTNYANDVEFTERLVLKGSYADFYLNGELVRSDIDASITLSGVSNHLMVQGLGSGYYIDLKAVKIRVGEA